MGNVFYKHFFRQLFQTIYARFNVRLERFTHEFNTPECKVTLTH